VQAAVKEHVCVPLSALPSAPERSVHDDSRLQDAACADAIGRLYQHRPLVTRIVPPGSAVDAITSVLARELGSRSAWTD
jgi:hypothetical protein